MTRISEDQAIQLYDEYYENEEQAGTPTRNMMDFHEWIEAKGHNVEWKPRELPEWRKRFWN